MYALFGHSALRVTDPVLGLDQVYNYGTFDFRTEYFYWRFLRGDLRYFLSIEPFQAFCQGYAQEGRAVQEQVLALTPTEAQRVYARLETTRHSAARYYRYQFFADNCSTRLFELLEGSLTAPLQLDSAGAGPPLSYRQLLAPYLARAPWVQLGMNLGLGLPADQTTTFRQRLFLPLELQQALARAQRQGRSLIARQRLVVPAAPHPAAPHPAAPHPAAPLGLPPLAVLLGWMGASSLLWWRGVSAWLWQLNRQFLFGLAGVMGSILLGFSLFSLHTPTYLNYQILWLLPSHLLLIGSTTRPGWKAYAAGALVLLLIGSLVAAGLGYLWLLLEVGVLQLLLAGHLIAVLRPRMRTGAD